MREPAAVLQTSTREKGGEAVDLNELDVPELAELALGDTELSLNAFISSDVSNS